MEKPKIFISHITEEKDLAKILKDEISKAFLGLPEIFASSDNTSISIGTKWLDEIDQALKDAQIILLLCSKNSITRPWINFEAGAGWIKGIPVVPICHTDIKPVELPIPLNMLQGIELTNKAGLERVIDLVAKQLGAGFTPELQFDRIIEHFHDFEKNYGLVQVASYHVKNIISIEPQFNPLFNPNPPTRRGSGFISDIMIDKLRPHLEQLQDMNMVSFAVGGNTQFTNLGVELEFNLEVHQSYYDIAEKVMK